MSSGAPTLPTLPETREDGLETRQQHAAIQARLFGGETAAVTLGRFVVLEPLGRGAMGVVHAAYDPQLDRRVAVKVLRHPRGEEWTEEAAARPLREARAMAQLVHPNVLTVYEAAVAGSAVYIAMELVEGQTLGQWCRQNPPSTRSRFDDLLDLAVQAARGLVAAHDAGLVHRDLKPANILVGHDGRLRVADFGLARATTDPELLTTQGLGAAPAESETRTGDLVGTPAYMAPEQFGGRGDARSDQWALCATLWEAAYGLRPFGGQEDGIEGLRRARLEHDPRLPDDRPEVPRWFRDALLRGLAADPAERHPDVRSLLVLLQRGRRRATGRGWWAAGAVTVLLGGALVATTLAQDDPAAACPSVSDQLDALWGPQRRGRVQEAFAATGRAHAPSTFERASEQVRAYADALAQMRRDSCEATRRGEQSDALLDLRTRCLDAREHGFDALLTQWEQTLDADVLDRVLGTIPTPSSIAPCADAERLHRAHPPPPAEQLADVATLEGQLDELDALLQTGREDSARPRIEGLVATAQALDYPPTLARALQVRGRIEAFGDPARAIATYESALEQATRARSPELERVAWFGLANALEHEQRHAEARWALRGAAGAVERDASDPAARRSLLFATGLNAGGRGDAVEAARALEQSLELARAADPRSYEVARTLHQLAEIRTDHGDLPAALEASREALALMQDLIGDAHPQVAAMQLQLGTLLLEQGQLDQGQARIEAARDAWVVVFGEDHRHVAGATMLMGRVLAQRGDLPAALAKLDRAVAIFERSVGKDDPNLAIALSTRSLVLRDLDRHDDAERDIRRSLRIRERALGPEHPAVGESVTNLANLDYARERFASAAEHHRRALAIKRKAFGEAATPTGIALLNLGMSEAGAGQWAQAHEHYEEAIEILEATLPAEHPHLALARSEDAAARAALARPGAATPR